MIDRCEKEGKSDNIYNINCDLSYDVIIHKEKKSPSPKIKENSKPNFNLKQSTSVKEYQHRLDLSETINNYNINMEPVIDNNYNRTLLDNENEIKTDIQDFHDCRNNNNSDEVINHNTVKVIDSSVISKDKNDIYISGVMDNINNHNSNNESDKKDNASHPINTNKILSKEKKDIPNQADNRRTYAQAITTSLPLPHAPTYKIASFPYKDGRPSYGNTDTCGVLVDRVPGTNLDTYMHSIFYILGEKTITFLGHAPGNSSKILAFLTSETKAKRLVETGLNIRGRWYNVSHLKAPATKVVISDVLPFIEDDIIIKACEAFGTVVYPSLRSIPASIRSSTGKGILSFRREIFINLNKNTILPENITINHNSENYTLDLSTTGLSCFNCGLKGHTTAYCALDSHKTKNSKKQSEEQDKQWQQLHEQKQIKVKEKNTSIQEEIGKQGEKFTLIMQNIPTTSQQRQQSSHNKIVIDRCNDIALEQDFESTKTQKNNNDILASEAKHQIDIKFDNSRDIDEKHSRSKQTFHSKNIVHTPSNALEDAPQKKIEFNYQKVKKFDLLQNQIIKDDEQSKELGYGIDQTMMVQQQTGFAPPLPGQIDSVSIQAVSIRDELRLSPINDSLQSEQLYRESDKQDHKINSLYNTGEEKLNTKNGSNNLTRNITTSKQPDGNNFLENESFEIINKNQEEIHVDDKIKKETGDPLQLTPTMEEINKIQAADITSNLLKEVKGFSATNRISKLKEYVVQHPNLNAILELAKTTNSVLYKLGSANYKKLTELQKEITNIEKPKERPLRRTSKLESPIIPIDSIKSNKGILNYSFTFGDTSSVNKKRKGKNDQDLQTMGKGRREGRGRQSNIN